MKSSISAEENGWVDYPAEHWDKRRPPDTIGDLPFWEHYARKFGEPILDVACGNDRISIPLAEKGYQVVGIDINRQFIESAKKRLCDKAEVKQRVTFIVGDIVTLDIPGTFRTAIMPDWGFQVLLTQEDQISFLERLHDRLLPSGAFCFTVFMSFNRQRSLVVKDGKYIWSPDPSYHKGAPREYAPVSQIEDLVEDNIHDIRLRHTNLSELRLLFRLTGFEIAELYGSDDWRPFTGNIDNDYTIIAKVI